MNHEVRETEREERERRAAASTCYAESMMQQENHTKTGGEAAVPSNKTATATSLSTEASTALKDLRFRRKYRYVTLRVGEDGAVVPDGMGDSSQDWRALESALPYSDCRYAILEQDQVKEDGRKTSRLIFIAWMPHAAQAHTKVKDESCMSF